MAWYTIDYICGHSDREQVYGSGSQRESYIDWAQNNKLCPECWEAKKTADWEAKKQEYAVENALSVDCAKALCLPPLAGSPKQVAWAETIRTKCILWSGGVVETMDEAAIDPVRFQLMREFETWFESRTRARWWIDNRDEDPIYMVRKIYREWVVVTHPEVIDQARAALAEKKSITTGAV